LNRLHTGWLGADWQSWERFDVPLPLFDDARMFEQGTRNVIGISAFSENIKILLEFGLKSVYKRILAVKEKLRQSAEELDFEILTPRKGGQSGMITIRPQQDARELYKQLRKNNILISLRNNCLRLSPHFYNTEEEAEEIMRILER